MDQAIEQYLAANAGEAQALLERLCRQPSIAAQGVGIDAMAALVEGLLGEAGFATRRLLADGAPPAIFAELKGRSPYTLLLYNHYDVQPAEPLELWHSPAFEPTVRDGKLFARGSSDNKGEIAARLAAIRALRVAYGELPIGIKWIIEGEEEIGSPHFAAIAEPYAELLKADGCLWEGSGFAANGQPELLLGTKGLLYVQLDVACLSGDAHSGNAPILPSAAWRLVQALATLRSPEGRVLIPGFYDAVRPPSAAALAALADQPDTTEQLRETYGVGQFVDALSGQALRERQAFSPTCNIAGLGSGYTGEGSKTVLPARAMAKIDFRLVPDQDPDAILAALRAHLDAQGYADIAISTFGACEAVVTPIDDPFVRRIATIAAGYNGQPPVITPLIGGTLPLLSALRRFVGLPGLCAPGNPVYWANGMHAPDEHIRLADLDEAVRFNCHMFQALGA
ncbi:MAG TPA: M20/M25/M40 family metallo-hydrolase [Kouleothrix sp.]|uniref:M20/M25/M40 family metallo-hydrolase n=1 Tax=Kouleothrix sp. TaxID=2779161 RepID=UPI002D034648|nr:M20/M25/M40 family metallo-hydrolase [Kouleothrix sp.]HRC75728.1 M20/M25/M40 family metallo-hydrolase [Kouleothrix sp.]